MRPAAFLDRDGTIIFDRNYLADPAGVALLPGSVEALKKLRDEGYLLVIISNQSGVARGLIQPAQHEAVHARCVEVLRAEGIDVDAAYYCFHGPSDGCDCRKPQPGLLHRAADEHRIDLARSLMIGDRTTDVQAGEAAGCQRSILLTDAGWAGFEWSM